MCDARPTGSRVNMKGCVSWQLRRRTSLGKLCQGRVGIEWIECVSVCLSLCVCVCVCVCVDGPGSVWVFHVPHLASVPQRSRGSTHTPNSAEQQWDNLTNLYL